MWVAKDDDGEMFLYNDKPFKLGSHFVGHGIDMGKRIKTNFKMTSNPQKVKLIIEKE